MKDVEAYQQLIKLLSVIEGKDILSIPQKTRGGANTKDNSSSIKPGDRPLVDDAGAKTFQKRVVDLGTDLDNYERYINLDGKNDSVSIIPCGVGNADYGFRLIGVDEKEYSDLQAVVYNFLIRSTHIDKEFYPQYIREGFFSHELDYGHVYRYIMLLLEMMKPNGETKILLNLIGDEEEFKAAQDILNIYLGLFARLMRTTPSSISVELNNKAKSISVTESADYCVEDFDSDQGLIRQIKYGNKINYQLDESNKEDLEYLLREISPFIHFKHGQFDALCSMVNARKHAVCIMPTGSGKSLIYYFASILQPRVVFVVSPTDILIRDQIRNLKKFHNYDSASHLNINYSNDFTFYKPASNLVFLTPSTFQNVNLFKRFRYYASDLIAYVVLDEIHCISNWGHDFRPEYLMLSKNLKKHLEKTTYLGFTATANYTVAQDIERQLGIPEENFFSPILFERYNVKYVFKELDDMDKMLTEVSTVANELVHNQKRIIVFTKSDDLSIKVADAIGYEADVFTSNKPEAYKQFVEGNCNVLVASEELGVGINLPNVNCTIHFGMPVSKNEFVQEIGRAGRADESVTSYVLYLKPSENNLPSELLKRDSSLENISDALHLLNNDYSEAYKKFTCGTDTSDVLCKKLLEVYWEFRNCQKQSLIRNYSFKEIEPLKQLFYMLFVTGYINDWYAYATTDAGIQMIIDICDNNNNYLFDVNMLERMQERSTQYFVEMGNDRESIFKVARATKPEDILKIYVDWYYRKFLYHHKEQFLDFFEFITNNKDCNSIKITEEIEDYFILPFVQIKEDEAYYTNMSFEEISQKAVSGLGKNTISNLERINSNTYSYRLDYLIFMGNWARNGRFYSERLDRFWNYVSDQEKEIFISTIVDVYGNLGMEARWNCLRYFDDEGNATGISISQIMDKIYKTTTKDNLYYGILARSANKKFEKFVRSI